MSGDSSGGVSGTADTVPVTGDSPTAIPGSTSDAAGGPEIPGPPLVPQFEEEDHNVALAAVGTAVAFGVAAVAGAAAAPVVAGGAAAAAAAAAFIAVVDAQMLTAEGEGDRPDEDGDPADDG